MRQLSLICWLCSLVLVRVVEHAVLNHASDLMQQPPMWFHLTHHRDLHPTFRTVGLNRLLTHEHDRDNSLADCSFYHVIMMTGLPR